MNVFTASTLNHGLGPLSPEIAEQMAAYLIDQLPKTQPCDQRVILNLIHGLRELPKPEAAFGDLYLPLGYPPGWAPDP